MTRRRAAAQSAAPLDLLRRAVRGLLREADLSGRPLALVGRLVEINRDLAAAGLALEIGLATYPDVDDEQRFEFAARSRLRRGEPRGYTRRDLREPDSQLSVVYQLQEGDVEALAAPGVEELLDRVPWGAIVIEPAGAAAAGPCAAAWVVQLTSNTRDGWGPLLYDAAMEWASSMGGGLAPDRRTVSPEAAAVWGKYVSSRGDVVPVQLDVRQKDLQADPERWGRQLTPDDATDDCVQKSAQLHSPEDWSESPLSRAFRKTGNPVTAALRAADLFWAD